jgi:hypothetical protein
MSLSQYKPLPTPSESNGSIYNAGYIIGQQNALNQNALIQTTSGGKKRSYFKGGNGQIPVQPVPVAYNDGGVTQTLVTDLTKINATTQAQAKYDGNVTKGGNKTRRRHKKNKRTNNKRNIKKTKRARRISRRRV